MTSSNGPSPFRRARTCSPHRPLHVLMLPESTGSASSAATRRVALPELFDSEEDLVLRAVRVGMPRESERLLGEVLWRWTEDGRSSTPATGDDYWPFGERVWPYGLSPATPPNRTLRGTTESPERGLLPRR
jgi:hypothetical protein